MKPPSASVLVSIAERGEFLVPVAVVMSANGAIMEAFRKYLSVLGVAGGSGSLTGSQQHLLTPRRPKCLRTRPPWRPSWKHIIFSKSYEKIINRTHHNSSGSLKASLFAYNVREESTLSWPLYRFSVQNSAGSWNFFSSSSSSLYHFMKIKNLAFLSVRERNS